MPSRKIPKPPNGGIAVGAYLRALREASGLTIAQIAISIPLDDVQIWRIERWDSDPSSSTLFKLVQILRGDPADVALLINNPQATKDDGANLAKLRIQIRER
jgi:transcriptional regulator with XRE-family HTH domain